MMLNGTVIWQVFITLFLNVATSLRCPPGTFLYTIIHSGQQFCIDCQDGTFIPHKAHQQAACKPCETAKDPELEILVSPCNKTHDAVIHCVDGYYRDEARNPRETGTCKKCTECEFVGQTCSTYKNTVCCWDENYDVVLNNDGVPVCRERPWFCRRGQFFDTSAFQCLQCPKQTFMPLDYHIQPECWNCREYDNSSSNRPLHSVIILPCNSTQAPVIKCENGFFMNPNMGYRDDAIGCSPCTDCSTKTDVQYEGRKCDGMEDTVCCPHPNMTVHDTPEGPVCCPHMNMTVIDTPDGLLCTASSVLCGEGQCLHYNTRNMSGTCVLCSHNIDVDDSKDTATEDQVQDLWLKKEVSKDDQGDHNVHGTSFSLGLTLGILVAVIGCWVYITFLKDHCHRWSKSWFTSWLIRHKTKDPDDIYLLQQLHTKMTTDHYGRNQCCGDESDLHSKKNLCRNNRYHPTFHSVKTFSIENFSEDFPEDDKMEYIKAVCDLTVRLKVNHTSKDRPDDFSCRELRDFAGAGIKRFGTGLVYEVSKRFGDGIGATCPCRFCSVCNDDAKDKWAEFAVVTAAQLVYDNDECKRTSCRLWFNDDNNFVQAPSLKGRRVKNFNENQDFRVLYCVTHDEEVSQKLDKMVDDLNRLRQKYKHTSEAKTDGNRLAVLISHQHGLSKKISVDRAQLKTLAGGIQKWSYDVETCPGSCGAPVCLLGRGQGTSILTTIHSLENESTGFYLH